jgi:hypothetical protein
MDDNIKMDLKETDERALHGFIWLKISTRSGLL